MGNLLIAALVIFGAIFVVFVVSVQDKSEELPELLTSNYAELQAKAICREALLYGIDNVNTGKVVISSQLNSQVFNDFELMGGTVDSIHYITNATVDTIYVTAYATFEDAGVSVQHKSSVVLAWVPTLVRNAIVSNGVVDVGGSADIDGDVIENSQPVISFEEVFGITKPEMQAIADNYIVDPGLNPDGVNGITWVEITAPNGRLKVTSSLWDGSGILIVDGDVEFQGGTFYGLLWITGTLFFNGNDGFDGAIYCEGGVDYDDSLILGDSQVTYSFAAIRAVFDEASIVFDYDLQVVSWFEGE